MRRNSLIAQALSEPPINAVVLLISGTKEMNAMSLAPGIDCVTLPALMKAGPGDYRPRNLAISRAELTAIRAKTIEGALEAFEPDLFIVDKLPRGVFCELDGALTQLKRSGARCVLGLRDILDDPGTVRKEWESTSSEKAIECHYHAVWVYGDPTVFDLLKEYNLSTSTAEKVRFTGYLDPSQRFVPEGDVSGGAALDAIDDSKKLIFCQVGGGEDGDHVAETFAETELPDDSQGVILTGPFMRVQVRARLNERARVNPRLSVIEFASEPTLILKRANKVIAMGGYNTVCEVLAMEKSALIVPRTTPRTEQLIRAERFRDLGALSLITPHSLTPVRLAAWLARDLPAPSGIRDRIDFNGIARIPHLADELLAVA